MDKLFIFDIGGVLLQDFDITKDLSKYLNVNITSVYSSSSMADHYKGLIDEEEFWNNYMAETNIKLNPKEDLFKKFFFPTVDEETVNIIKDLRNNGYRVVAGTNIMTSHYEVANDMALFDNFDKAYCSHLMNCKKPDEGFFTYILKAENKKPEDVYFIDDLEENIQGAKKMGINTFLFTSAKELRSKLNHII